jgi:hypothetical protein
MSIDNVVYNARSQRIYPQNNGVQFDRISGAAAIALHMHQPLIPASGGDLRTAAIIGNLQHMMENQGIGDNHNAPDY